MADVDDKQGQAEGRPPPSALLDALDDDALYAIFAESLPFQSLVVIAQVCTRFAAVAHEVFDQLKEREADRIARAQWQEWLEFIRASSRAESVLVCSRPDRTAAKVGRARTEALRLATRADGTVDDARQRSTFKRLAVKCAVFGNEWLDEPAGSLRIPVGEIDALIRLITVDFCADPSSTFGRRFVLAGASYVTQPCPARAFYQSVLVGRSTGGRAVLAAMWRYPRAAEHAAGRDREAFVLAVLPVSVTLESALPGFLAILDGGAGAW